MNKYLFLLLLISSFLAPTSWSELFKCRINQTYLTRMIDNGIIKDSTYLKIKKSLVLELGEMAKLRRVLNINADKLKSRMDEIKKDSENNDDACLKKTVDLRDNLTRYLQQWLSEKNDQAKILPADATLWHSK